MFWEIHLELIDFHMKNLERELLFFYNKKLKFLTDLSCRVMCFCFAACIVYPVIDSIFNGKSLAFTFLVPFTEDQSNFGFSINLANQSFLIGIAGCGYVVFLRLYLLLFAHLCVRVDVLVETANELHDPIIENENVSLKLTEIVTLHLDFLRFITLSH